MYEHDELIKDYILNDDGVKYMFGNQKAIARYIVEKENLDTTVDAFRKKVKRVFDSVDLQLIKQNVEYNKQKQKQQDTNRIERKGFREFARIDNAVVEYTEALKTALDNHDISKFTIIHETINGGCIGILHLTDWHFNELIELSFNKYDFNVASKRLKKFVTKSLSYFKANNVTKVFIAMTGDMMNSDRRLDELLNQATNRANATMLAVYLFEQMIVEINKFYNIDIACVSGNESRVKDEVAWSGIMATDNYDFTIFNILKYIFKGSDGINFIVGDPIELVVEVNGHNILLLHGNCSKIKSQSDIQSIIGKYASQGINVRLIIYGHLHCTQISDFHARGSSPAGANDYSDKGLQLHSMASQNIHLVGSDSIDSIKIDLQNYDNKGYDIIDELKAYNVKSAAKKYKETTIFKITI